MTRALFTVVLSFLSTSAFAKNTVQFQTKVPKWAVTESCDCVAPLYKNAAMAGIVLTHADGSRAVIKTIPLAPPNGGSFRTAWYETLANCNADLYKLEELGVCLAAD